MPAAARSGVIVDATLTALVVVAGFVGSTLAQQHVEAALATVDPRHAAALRAMAERQGALPTRFGLIVAAVCVVPLLVGELRRLTRSGRRPAR